MKMSRIWCMPNANTFSMKPVEQLLDRYLTGTVVDPFARNSDRAKEYSNDLNPQTEAKYHMDAVDFCQMLVNNRVKANSVLFDPPYSPRQIKECYESIGRKTTFQDTQNARLYRQIKSLLSQILEQNGIAISFGWNSSGFGKKLGFEMLEIVLISHGGAHNDTIVTVERKLSQRVKKSACFE